VAQGMPESAGRATQFEKLKYSHGRLPKIWPSRFQAKGLLAPVERAQHPEKLANEV